MTAIHKTLVTMSASGHAQNEREINDYYATDPIAMELLLEKESFSKNVWECACGGGHLSRVLEAHGHNVMSTDLIYHGYGAGGVDFLQTDVLFDGDIVTNPPYKYAQQFVEHALNCVGNGHKVAMFLRLQFLEGKARQEMFERIPPKVVYVASARISCALGGDFKNYKNGAQAFAWFVWEKGYKGETVLRWFN